MTPIKKLMPFILVLVLGVLLQASFVLLDCRQTPDRAAMDFASAYFRLDPAMADQLYKGDTLAQRTTMVSNFIERAKADITKRGFSCAMAKSALYDVKTSTVQKNDQEAKVHLTAYRKTAINPIFLFIAKVFNLGKTYHVDETIKMMKEGGRWKVCSPVFDIAAIS